MSVDTSDFFLTNPDLHHGLLGVNTDKALMVKMYQISGVMPFYAHDVIQQVQVEDDLWEALLEHEKNGNPPFPPLQLSAHNQDVGMTVAFKSLSAEQFARINTGQSRYYFLTRLFNSKGVSVLDVCFSMDKVGEITYCRGHNN